MLGMGIIVNEHRRQFLLSFPTSYWRRRYWTDCHAFEMGMLRRRLGRHRLMRWRRHSFEIDAAVNSFRRAGHHRRKSRRISGALRSFATR